MFILMMLQNSNSHGQKILMQILIFNDAAEF